MPLPHAEIASFSATRYASPLPAAICPGVIASAPFLPGVRRWIIGIGPSDWKSTGNGAPYSAPWPQPRNACTTCDACPVWSWNRAALPVMPVSAFDVAARVPEAIPAEGRSATASQTRARASGRIVRPARALRRRGAPVQRLVDEPPAALDHPGVEAQLDRLDERVVLPADLARELRDRPGRLVVDVVAEEAIDPAP